MPTDTELIMSGEACTGCLFDETVFKNLSRDLFHQVLTSLWIHCWQRIGFQLVFWWSVFQEMFSNLSLETQIHVKGNSFLNCF